LVLATTLAGTAWSQSASQIPVPEVLGYLNPANNSFRPMIVQQPIENPAAVSVLTGKLVTNFTITVTTAVPSTSPITCDVTASVNDVQTSPPFSVSNIILEQAAYIATRGAGKATCTVTIPYSWRLSNQSTDKVQLSYSITTGGSATTAGSLALRTSSQTIAVIPVPLNGKTTIESVSATI
jgi:hypothetical protein